MIMILGEKNIAEEHDEFLVTNVNNTVKIRISSNTPLSSIGKLFKTSSR